MKKKEKKALQPKNEEKPRGLISGLKNFLGALKGMEKKGLTEKTVSRKKRIGKLATAKYGYRIRIGLNKHKKEVK